MTVAELIEQLQKMPPDHEVWVEDYCCGCSSLAEDVMCVNDMHDLSDHPYVTITG